MKTRLPISRRGYTRLCALRFIYPDDCNAAAEEDPHHDIEEIIVTATPLERTVEQLAQPTSVLSGDDLAKKQSSSIGETVSAELGVSSTWFGPVASRPVIRGQFGERVLVLSNALDAMDASALSEDHAVSVEGILAERVEIVRGPATLLYGSGAAGGLVNVVDSRIVEAQLDDPMSGAISLGSDSATGLVSGAGKIAFGNERVAAHLDYYRRDTDDVEIPGFAESAQLRAMEVEEGEEHEVAFGVVDNTDSRTDGGAAAVTLTGDSSHIGIAYSLHDSNYGIPGHEHHEEGEEEADVRIDLEQKRLDLKASYNFTGPVENVKLRIARNDYKHVELEGAEIGTVFDTVGTDARMEFRHTPFGDFQGAFGLQFKDTDFTAVGEEAFVPSSQTQQSSLFLFEEWGLSDTWTVQGSARVEHQSVDAPSLPSYSDTAWGGSIGAIWGLSDLYTLSANLALTERHPNSTELFADGAHLAVGRVERGSVILGNGFLGNEFSTNIDVTLRGGGERIEFDITGFINIVDDYILLAPTGDIEDELPVFHYEATDVEMYGVEAQVRIELMEAAAGHLHARVFADFVHAEEKDSGEYLPRIPPLRYGIGLHYTRDAFEAAIDTVFHDDQPQTAPNELPTDSYTTVNAEVAYALGEPDLFLFLRGTNLTDEEARQHTSPLKDTFPMPGRSLRLGLRYDF